MRIVLIIGVMVTALSVGSDAKAFWRRGVRVRARAVQVNVGQPCASRVRINVNRAVPRSQLIIGRCGNGSCARAFR